MHLILVPSGTLVPSHLLYANDVLIFVKGTEKNIDNLNALLYRFDESFCQIVNYSKSGFYSGFVVASRIHRNEAFIGLLYKGFLPFKYLLIPIFKGNPKKIQALVDIIKVKFATWRDSLLSMAF